MSDVITTDPFKILESLRNFNKDLYNSMKVNLDSPGSRLFFHNPNIPKITDDLRNLCEGEVTIEEATEVLNTFKQNKVTGNDALPSEFYKKILASCIFLSREKFKKIIKQKSRRLPAHVTNVGMLMVKNIQ